MCPQTPQLFMSGSKHALSGPPCTSYPDTGILQEDNRTLGSYGLNTPLRQYYIDMYNTPDLIPQGDPGGSVGYHVKFRIRNGQHGGQDILLRGLGWSYSVDRVMYLVQAKNGIEPDDQEWRVPVVNLDLSLKTYTVNDGDVVEGLGFE